jgi:hypothetical protein
VQVPGTADFDGDGTLATTGTPHIGSDASFSGGGGIGGAEGPQSVLSGSGTLTVSALMNATAAVVLSGDGVLTAGGTVLSHSALFTGSGTLTVIALGGGGFVPNPGVRCAVGGGGTVLVRPYAETVLVRRPTATVSLEP